MYNLVLLLSALLDRFSPLKVHLLRDNLPSQQGSNFVLYYPKTTSLHTLEVPGPNASKPKVFVQIDSKQEACIVIYDTTIAALQKSCLFTFLYH